MDYEVILHVGEKKFFLSRDEALSICGVLNSASRAEKTWVKDVAHDKAHVLKAPDFVAWVTPMTTLLQMEIEHNMKILEEKK